MSGQLIPLEQTCNFLSGYAWSAANFETDPVGLPIIRIQNVDAVRDSDFVYWGGEYDERFVVRPGDLLLTLSGSFRAVVWQGPDALLNQRIVKLTPKPGYSLDWLLHVLRNGLNTISGLGRHALVSNVALADLRQLKVPSHTSEEQRRIAAILDQAETLRTQRRQALAHLDTLTQSLFLDMFGDPAVEASEWPKTQLDEVAELVTGYPFRSEEYVGLADGIKLCRGVNVLPGRLDWRDMACWPVAKVKEAEAFHLQAGDVVMAMDRPWISEGFKLAQVDAADCPMLLVQRVARIRPKSDLTNEYLFAVLNHVAFTRHCKPTETTIPHISPKDIRSFAFPLPPLPLQQTFATRIQAIEALKATHRAALAQLDALFASLQQRAFAGGV